MLRMADVIILRCLDVRINVVLKGIYAISYLDQCLQIAEPFYIFITTICALKSHLSSITTPWSLPEIISISVLTLALYMFLFLPDTLKWFCLYLLQLFLKICVSFVKYRPLVPISWKNYRYLHKTSKHQPKIILQAALHPEPQAAYRIAWLC